MTKKNKKFLWIGGSILALLLILNGITGIIVHYVWLHELHFEQVFWKIKVTQWLLFLAGLITALLFLGLNVRYINKQIKGVHLNMGSSTPGMAQEVYISAKAIQYVLYGLVFVLSLFFAFRLSTHWDEWLKFSHAQSFGLTDPLFGKEVSFFVFSLPFIELVQSSLTSLTFKALLIIILFYFINKAVIMPRGQKFNLNIYFSPRARKQIFVNFGIWFLLLSTGYFLDRFHLAYKHNSLIDGANYTDIHVLLPLFWILTIVSLLVGIYSFIHAYQNKKPQVFILSALSILVINFIGHTFIPGMVQNYKVRPNEFRIEEPYIQNNMDYTRKAYDLDQVQTKSHHADDSITLEQILAHRDATKNIRIWDQNLAVETYKQLQEIRLYYEFDNIDLDRYQTEEKGYRQVLISARELASTLPAKAQTWVNSHLQYTHGSGIVMSPTTEKTEEGNPFFYLKDIPPRSDIGMEVKNPAIYYGETPSDFKIVNTKISELDYPKGDKNVYTHYEGKGGIPISNFWTQLLFSWHFKDINILLTEYIQKGSRIQLWRDVSTRLNKIAPFLTYDDDPYIVLDDGRLYWMHDAYTTASGFPYSEPYSGKKNYIRNSVKVVVDAYNGDVSFYVANPEDPVIQVYQKVFPNIFKSLDKMPGNLKAHIKYPKDLFQIQMEKYSVYHMTDTRVFYNREDLWNRPKETYGGKEIEMKPYYILSELPGSKKLEYMLISPMTPQNRDNMISWMVVKSDFPGYGEIYAYELPKESLFLGPAQIEAKINQNTEISRQISLWDQRGSQVIRGNLMVIPIENSFLYVEPVFLFSTTTNIPQLKRVIATTGTKVVMEPTLDDALYALYGQTKPTLDIPEQVEQMVQPLIQNTSSSEFKKVKGLWSEMEKAIQNKDWKSFGEKMEEIKQTLEKEE